MGEHRTRERWPGWVWAEYLSCGKKVPPPEWELDCRHGWIEIMIGGEGVRAPGIEIIDGEDESKLRIEDEAVADLQKALRRLKVCEARYWTCHAWANRNVKGFEIKFKRKPSYC
jgi:hypothetical protein